MSDVTLPEPGEAKSVTLKANQPSEIRVPHPIQFYFETKTGTKIKGVITPEHPLQITPKEDIATLTLLEGAIQEK